MLLKRKRSSDTEDDAMQWAASPSPPSSDSDGSSEHQLPAAPTGIIPYNVHYDSGRTMKRHRDNRPDERAIHHHTLSILYAAQCQMPDSEDQGLPRLNPSGLEQPVQAASSSTQPSLHTFWSLPKASKISIMKCDTVHATLMRCQDCDRNIELGRDEDMDGSDLASAACQLCSRSVCNVCAVRTERRLCLECVMRL